VLVRILKDDNILLATLQIYNDKNFPITEKTVVSLLTVKIGAFREIKDNKLLVITPKDYEKFIGAE
jgi:hypothetical protein